MRTKLTFRRSRGTDGASPEPEAVPPLATSVEATCAEAGPADAKPTDARPADEAAAMASEAPTAPAEPVRRAARMIEGVRPFERRLRGALAGTAWRRPAAIAAAVVMTGGLGYAAGHGLHRSGSAEQVAALRLGEATSAMRRGHEEMIRLGGELKAMKVAVDALKGERERARGELLGKQAQLSDKVERTNAETVGRIGKVAEQLERIERAQRDPQRQQGLIERLERIEKHVASAKPSETAAVPVPVASATPTPPAKPAGIASAVQDVTQTGSLPDARKMEPKADLKADLKPEPDPRKVQLDGYVLRDIDDGYALIEMKNGRFVEVAAGGVLPGIGRIESIERRGRQWVVLTPKGYIGERERGGAER